MYKRQELKKYGDYADDASNKYEGLTKTLKAAGTAIAAVAVAAGAAAIKLGKEVISAYADYEQLVGGIDTLFKDSSLEMQRYAANAYKTAGMSANNYMDTERAFLPASSPRSEAIPRKLSSMPIWP